MSAATSSDRFQVVILYESKAFVGRAMSAYRHLKQELGNDVEFELHLWRLDVATVPEFAGQADRDIERADVILIAVRDGQSCPAAFLRWKTGTGSGLGVPHGAVIAITATTAAAAPGGQFWGGELSAFTTQIHPEILVWDPPAKLSQAAPAPLAAEEAPLMADAVAVH